MVQNLAHRGASEYAPENTLAGFYKGIEMDADGIETDLRISKDGVIVLFHDRKLDRTTSGSGDLRDYTWPELSRLDAGIWFSRKYAGERLITLEQFLHHFGAKDLILALELKDRGIARQTLDLIGKYDVRNQVTLTSFHYEDLEAVRAIDSEIRIGWLVRSLDDRAIEQIKAIDGVQICPPCEGLEQTAVADAKQRGLEVRAWGASSEELMIHALNCGVDGMTVNFPDKLAAAAAGKANKAGKR